MPLPEDDESNRSQPEPRLESIPSELPVAAPAPLFRPPIPGSRTQSGAKIPRLGLAIPPSPNAKSVGNNATSAPPVPPQSSGRPGPPSLRLATPMGAKKGAPALKLATPMGSGSTPLQNGNGLAPQISSDDGGGRSGGAINVEGRGSDPTSAASQYSALSFALGLRQSQSNDPASAVGSTYSDRQGAEGGSAMERNGSMNGMPDIDKLSLDNKPTLDVDDLDDEGWRAASVEKRIVELGSLGEGAGGAVTKCILKGGKTVFALKIITTDPNPDVKKQIVRELNFNKDCASEYICRYYGAFVDLATGTIFIAMEICEGGSLDSIYKEVKKLGGRTGEKVLAKVAEGVLNGLTYLHSRKIIHRGKMELKVLTGALLIFPDIKPSNILLCRNGQVKLCDFGVSGEFGTKGDANTFIGTSYYMAPERITGQSYTITSDVWSLGVSLLEVAQHRFPFPADGTEMQPRAAMIDLLTYIVRQKTPTLKDEEAAGIKWSDNFKYFIECWYVP
ncbi:MAG: Protein kinase C signaling pathway involved MAPKK protein [Vezdaea aestivalis]|nr:MAG: Protein kinase C signaling pathway involved MAPKK protein [Vezdaea aestivalis]